MPSRNVSHEVQAELLKAARRGQEVVGHAIKTSASRLPKPEQLAGNARDLAAKLPKPDQVAGNVHGIASRLPMSEQLAGRVRGIVTRLPKPEQVAGNALGLAERLLASQRKFADQVLRATTLQLPGKRRAGQSTAAENGQGSSDDTGAGGNGSR